MSSSVKTHHEVESAAVLAMLRYTRTGKGVRLALLVHHDDGVREIAHGRDLERSPLIEALDKAGEHEIALVDMKSDWKVVFGSVAQDRERHGA